jgi:hypothetical protein
MLVAVVVALGVVVFTFASGGLGTLTGNFTHLIANQGNAVDENLVVMQVTFTFTGTAGADVFVRNDGTITSTLVSVFVVDQSTGALVSQFTTGSLPATLNAGAFFDINLHQAGATFTPAHGHTYLFKVTSSFGSSVSFNAEAS